MKKREDGFLLIIKVQSMIAQLSTSVDKKEADKSSSSKIKIQPTSLQGVVGRTFALLISPQSSVVKILLIDGVPKFHGDFSLGVDEENIVDAITEIVIALKMGGTGLPTQPVGVGDKWQQQLTRYVQLGLFSASPLQIQKESVTVQRTLVARDQKRIVISEKQRTHPFRKGDSNHVTFTTSQGTINSTIVLDAQTNLLQDSQTTMRSSSTSELVMKTGKKIPWTTTNEFLPFKQTLNSCQHRVFDKQRKL